MQLINNNPYIQSSRVIFCYYH